ncbi:MAG: hypothetical protein OEZ01_04625 [Candidatus Heimdallarchaeota archaeon]|nr:hypothetical protein [Candidatus Heimdallarchaeota archaeon]
MNKTGYKAKSLGVIVKYEWIEDSLTIMLDNGGCFSGVSWTDEEKQKAEIEKKLDSAVENMYRIATIDAEGQGKGISFDEKQKAVFFINYVNNI